MSTAATSPASTRQLPLDAGGAPARRAPLFNLTYARLEARRVLRNRRTMIFVIVMPVFFYFAFGITQKQADARAYVMISLSVYAAMLAATSAGAAVSIERASGWSRQLRLTPLRPVSYVLVKASAALTISALPIIVEFIIGGSTGARMALHDWVIAALVAWIGSLVFAALGLCLGYLLPADNVMQFSSLIMVVLAFLGGLFIPITQYSATMQSIAKLTPAYGVGTLARYPLASEGSLWGAIANLVVWAVIFSAGAALLFRRDTARV
jgi:ABC-2 type transport system permease protein